MKGGHEKLVRNFVKRRILTNRDVVHMKRRTESRRNIDRVLRDDGGSFSHVGEQILIVWCVSLSPVHWRQSPPCADNTYARCISWVGSHDVH